MSDPIFRERLHIARQTTRFQCLWVLNHVLLRAMHKDPALTIELIATRLGWTPEHLENKLAGIHEIKLDDVASIAVAIDGTIIEPRLEPLSTPTPPTSTGSVEG